MNVLIRFIYVLLAIKFKIKLVRNKLENVSGEKVQGVPLTPFSSAFN